MATRVRIVTDSNAQFVNPGARYLRGLQIVPQKIKVQNQLYVETAEFRGEDFTASIIGSREPAELIAPTVAELEAFYLSVASPRIPILAIHMSGAHSETVKNARAAARRVTGRANVTVLDSQSLSVGLGILIGKALIKAESGLQLDALIRYINGEIQRLYAIFLTRDMRYLEKSGVIGAAEATMHDMLHLSPLLSLEEGELRPIEKGKTAEIGLEKLISFVSEFSDTSQLSVMRGQPQISGASRLLNSRTTGMFRPGDWPAYVNNASLSCIVGPNSVGVFIYDK